MKMMKMKKMMKMMKTMTHQYMGTFHTGTERAHLKYVERYASLPTLWLIALRRKICLTSFLVAHSLSLTIFQSDADDDDDLKTMTHQYTTSDYG